MKQEYFKETLMRKSFLLSMFLCCFSLWTVAETGTQNPHNVVGASECGECHEDEVAVWRDTKHYKSFYEVSKSEKGRKIAKNMGIKRIKKDAVCIDCHFLEGPKDGNIQPIAGISCESCHGPAKKWINVHSDYGGKSVEKQDEAPEHRSARLSQTKSAGMIKPGDLYDLADNCYGCHLVPEQAVVDTGGHAAGSKFELMSWSQGEIRHNFFRSDSGKENAISSAERKRLLFVIGQALELEHSLKGYAKATAEGDYAAAMKIRMQKSAKRVAWLAKTLKTPELIQMVAAIKTVKLKLGDSSVSAAATRIQAANKQLSESHDGSAWGALDPQLEKLKPKGTPSK